MSDVHSKTVRSYNMSRIRGKNTKPEEIVRKYLFSHGFRYKKNDPRLPGKPDIVLPKYKTVIFVHGCFWHHHNCQYFKWPATNPDFWKQKITGNENRDRDTELKLHGLGWRVIVIWECELKKERESNLNKLIDRLIISESPPMRLGQLRSINQDD